MFAKTLCALGTVMLTAGSLLAGEAPKDADEPAGVSQEVIDGWVGQLGDPSKAVRDRATEALVQIGGPAVAAVVPKMEADDEEVRRRAERVLREIERDAAIELEKHGAKIMWNRQGWLDCVSFRHHRDTGPVEDPGARYLQGLVHLQVLYLCYTQIKDEELVYLREKTELGFLMLHDTPITDEGLVHLSGLPKLLQLDVDNSNVTGTGLVHLTALPSLEILSLYGPRVTDRSIAGIGDVSDLRALCIGGRSFTDAGLAHVGKLAKLRHLEIVDASVTDRGLAHVSALVNLLTLTVQSSAITDAAVDELVKLKSLCILRLFGTRVTAAALHRLSRLSNLRHLTVVDMIFSQKELSELKSALPRVSVVWAPQSNYRTPIPRRSYEYARELPSPDP